MIVRLGVVLLVIAAVIFGISSYLSPDDIADCAAVTESGNCRRADAIVVVSGGDTIARTDEAIRLFQSDWAPLIVFSGAAADKSGLSNAEAMRRHAIAKGVPGEATVIEEQSETTKQNAEQVMSQLESLKVKDIILVTSGYHMRRASLEFSRQLGSDIEMRRHPVSSDKQWSAAWWLTPWGWWLALSELVKIGLFFVGGTR